jgi:ABC-2 type transport system permease protein
MDSLVWFIITILFYEYIYLYTDFIGGWSKSQIFLLIGTTEIIKSILMFFFINNLTRIPYYIKTGTLDLFLVIPISSQYLISIRNLDYGSLANFFPAVFIVVLQIRKLDVDIIMILKYMLISIPAMLLLYFIWFSIMCTSFWFIKIDELHEVFFSSLDFMKFPTAIFKGVFFIIFHIAFPVVLVSNSPVSIFVNKDYNLIYLLIIELIVFYLIYKMIWFYGLKKYESANI